MPPRPPSQGETILELHQQVESVGAEINLRAQLVFLRTQLVFHGDTGMNEAVKECFVVFLSHTEWRFMSRTLKVR